MVFERYSLPSRRERSYWAAIPVWVWVVLLVFMMAVVVWSVRRPRPLVHSTLGRKAPTALQIEAVAPRVSPLEYFQNPTVQANLTDNPADFIMPTASGKPESGLFGSVRTGVTAGKMRARFHEGIDIAPVRRDARSEPLDEVSAVAPGRVVFANVNPGNSDYGRFVVLEHEDLLGPVYTLYAHMASLSPDVRAGRTVTGGTLLGIMGHSSLSGISKDRAHVHFEIGLYLNPHFTVWSSRQKGNWIGGQYNGYNLMALNPVHYLRWRASGMKPHDMAAYLSSVPEAYRMVVRTSVRPAFFDQYPALWKSDSISGGAVVLSVSESGAPLAGWWAGSEESARLGKKGRVAVLSADAGVLGRNGRRYVVQKNGQWALGSSGSQWLEVLLFR